MKKILLISIFEQPQYINLGISQIAGFLREKNYDVTLKFYDNRMDFEDIFNDIKKLPMYEYVGFSIYQANINLSSRLTTAIKEMDKSITTFWGGAFASTYYESLLLDCPALDYVILGDGEFPLLYLLENNPLDQYPFIAQQNSNKKTGIYCNKAITWKIAYDFYEEHKGNFYVHNILTKSNMCTGHCTFCCTRKSGQFIYRPVEDIVNEISWLNKKYRIVDFNFVDDDIFDGEDSSIGIMRIGALCDQIISQQLDVNLYCYSKVNNIAEGVIGNELLNKMRKAGFATIFIGVESGNNTDLKLFNKKNTVEDNYRSINILKQNGICPTFGFINIHPYSTLETLKENYKFLVNVQSVEIMHYANSFLELYRGSPLYNMVKRDGLLNNTYTYMCLEDYSYVDTGVEKISRFLHTYFYNHVFANTYGWHQFDVFFQSKILRDNHLFPLEAMSEEDKQRNKTYQQEKQRKALKATLDYDNYIKSLNLQLTKESANEFNLCRIVQLSERTNRGNLSCRRYTLYELKRRMTEEKIQINLFRLVDRFGDYGYIAACVYRVDENKLDIVDLYLSCRAFSRNVEKLILNAILKDLHSNIQKVSYTYVNNKKNSAYERLINQLLRQKGFLVEVRYGNLQTNAD